MVVLLACAGRRTLGLLLVGGGNGPVLPDAARGSDERAVLMAAKVEAQTRRKRERRAEGRGMSCVWVFESN